jgi:hypothetical protein
MGRLGVGQRQVVLAQQGRHMGAAGVPLGGVAHHHGVRDRQRRVQRLGRAGVDFVVQRHPLGMGSKGGVGHAFLLRPARL